MRQVTAALNSSVDEVVGGENKPHFGREKGAKKDKDQSKRTDTLCSLVQVFKSAVEQYADPVKHICNRVTQARSV